MVVSESAARKFNNDQTSVQLSVIIPVFNQEKNIQISLARIRGVLDSTNLTYEIVVVDDGSFDGTSKVLQNEKHKDKRIKVISYTPNKGKGYAVRTGVIQSCGDNVMFTDGDLDISPYVIAEYVQNLENCDLVIASKRHSLSKINAPFSRKILSRMFNITVRIATGLNISDTQSGLKVGNGRILRAIFKVMIIKRYAFDVELLAIASLLRLNIKEMPIELNIDKRFKIKDIFNMLIDVASLSYRHKIKRWYHRQLIRSR